MSPILTNLASVNTSAHRAASTKETLEEKSPLPFLKWAGGKRKLAPIIASAIPASTSSRTNHFYEPFIGGGALSFYLGNPLLEQYITGKRLHINDMNPDLVTTYKVVRDDLGSLLRELKVFNELNNADAFYDIRSTIYEDPIQIAARFIYLNKTCFNGLWRVNSKGEFNVPFGRYRNPRILDPENLTKCSERLQGARITFGSYRDAVEGAKKGDLVYFDPPYIPISKTAAFSQYAKADFTLQDQQELSDCIYDLNKRGVKVILSNSDTRLTRNIFGPVLKLHQISVARTISSSASTRMPVHEVIGVNFKLPTDSLLHDYRIVN
jgi:DNA adenine methylase